MTTQIEHQTVFLTGATGAMGFAIAGALTRAGHTVLGVTRSAEGAAALRALGATPVEVDLFDADALRTAVKGAGVIAHFATKIPTGFAAMKPGAWTENDRLRLEATRNLLDAAAANGIGRFIFESYYGAYLDRGDDWIDETVPLAPVARIMSSVVAAEGMVDRFNAYRGEGVNLRFGRIYGPGRASDALVSMVRKRQMPVVGSGNNYVPSIHIDDAGSAVLHALTVPAGTYNVADDEPMRQSEYLRHIAAALGAPAPKRIPYPVARLLMGGLARAAVASQRLSNRRFREATGWLPRFASLREGWTAMAQPEREPVREGMVAR